MSTLQILTLLHGDLDPFVSQHGGQLSVSGTYVETLEVLTAGPRGFLCILEWLGEDNPSDANQAYIGIMRQEIGIYIAIHPGLPLRRGESLWLSADGRTLLERTAQVRDRIRQIRLEDDQGSTREFDYRGSRQVLTPDGLPLRAYRLEFHIHNALPDPAYRNVNIR